MLANVYTGIKAWLCASASHIAQHFGPRARQAYEDKCMKLETHYNVFQAAIKNTAAYIFVTGFGKVKASVRRTQFLPELEAHEVNETHEEPVSALVLPDMGKLYAEAQAAYNERFLLRQQKQQRENLAQQMRAQAKAEREEADQMQGKIWERNVMPRLARCMARIPEPPSYMSTLPRPDPHASFDDLQKSIREKLAPMIGEGRMALGLGYPSEIWSQVDACEAEMRRQAEEKRLQDEAEQRRINENRYRELVGELVQQKPRIEKALQYLGAFIGSGDQQRAAKCAEKMVEEICDPIKIVFEKMSEVMPLEAEGASILIQQWPMHGLRDLMNLLESQPWLPNSFLRLGYGIRAMCLPILTVVPFQDPVPVQSSIPVQNPVPVGNPLDQTKVNPTFAPQLQTFPNSSCSNSGTQFKTAPAATNPIVNRVMVPALPPPAMPPPPLPHSWLKPKVSTMLPPPAMSSPQASPVSRQGNVPPMPPPPPPQSPLRAKVPTMLAPAASASAPHNSQLSQQESVPAVPSVGTTEATTRGKPKPTTTPSPLPPSQPPNANPSCCPHSSLTTFCTAEVFALQLEASRLLDRNNILIKPVGKEVSRILRRLIRAAGGEERVLGLEEKKQFRNAVLRVKRKMEILWSLGRDVGRAKYLLDLVEEALRVWV